MPLPASVLMKGCDSMRVVEQVLTAARTFRPITADQTASLLPRTALSAAKGTYEPDKITQ
jgi:hypothetical protein